MTDTLLRWAQTLQARLTALVLLAVLVTVAIATAAALHEADATLVEGHRRSLDGETQRMARLLDHRAMDQLQVLELSVKTLHPVPQLSADAIQAWMLERPLLRAQFDSIFYVDAQGQVVLLHDDQGFKRPDINVVDRAYFQRTLREGRGVISEPLAGRVAGQPIIAMTAPVRRDGQVVGMLAGAMRLRTHSMLAGLEQDMPENTTTLVALTDAKGRILAHPDPGRVGLPAQADPRLAAALAEWHFNNEPIVPQALSINPGNDVGSVAGLHRVGWLLWRLQDRAEVMAPIDVARQRALRATVLLVVILLPVVAALLWWALRPLRRLERRAEQVFDMAPEEAEQFAAGEIGRVARAMQRVGQERRALSQQHDQHLAQLRSVMTAAPLGLMFTRDRRFELVSPHACRLLGLSEEELVGQSASIIYADPEDYARIGPAVGEAFARRQVFSMELAFRRGVDERFFGRLTGQPVDWGHAGAGTIWTLVDITDEVAARQQLEWSASHDVLTGLANRAALQQRLDRLLAMGTVAQPAALLMMDLDHFKPINDNHGHAAGDAMLRAVAQAIAGCVRTGDLVARAGGDEFVVLLERCAADVALRVADGILHAVQEIRVNWCGMPLGVGVSIGVAALHEHCGDAEAWLSAADAAAYEAKRAGRNTVRTANGLRPRQVDAPESMVSSA